MVVLTDNFTSARIGCLAESQLTWKIKTLEYVASKCKDIDLYMLLIVG